MSRTHSDDALLEASEAHRSARFKRTSLIVEISDSDSDSMVIKGGGGVIEFK